MLHRLSPFVGWRNTHKYLARKQQYSWFLMQKAKSMLELHAQAIITLISFTLAQMTIQNELKYSLVIKHQTTLNKFAYLHHGGKIGDNRYASACMTLDSIIYILSTSCMKFTLRADRQTWLVWLALLFRLQDSTEICQSKWEGNEVLVTKLCVAKKAMLAEKVVRNHNIAQRWRDSRTSSKTLQHTPTKGKGKVARHGCKRVQVHSSWSIRTEINDCESKSSRILWKMTQIRFGSRILTIILLGKMTAEEKLSFQESFKFWTTQNW